MELKYAIWEWSLIFINFVLALSLLSAIGLLLWKALGLLFTKLFHREQKNTTDIADQYGIIKGFIKTIPNIYPIDSCNDSGQRRVKTALEMQRELTRIRNLSDVFFGSDLIWGEKRDWIIENVVTNIINVGIQMSAWSCHVSKEKATNNERLLKLCAKLYEEHNKLSEEIKELEGIDRKDKIKKWLTKEYVTNLKNELDEYIAEMKRNIDESQKCQDNG